MVEHKFDVIARQKVAVDSLAQTEHGDGVVTNPAGNEIVQIELFKRAPHRIADSRAARATRKRARPARTRALGRRRGNSGPAVPANAHPSSAPAGYVPGCDSSSMKIAQAVHQ